MWRNAITCAFIWGVRDRSHELNSNMFLCRGNCFVRLRKKQSTCFASNWNWILSRRVYISVPPRFNKHTWALLPETLTRAYIDIVFQYLSRSQIIFASARWRKWLNGFNSSNKKFIWYSAVLPHCVGIETLLLKVRCRSVRRTWELSILVPREITRRWIHSHQHHS